jgi:hypothetical protein
LYGLGCSSSSFCRMSLLEFWPTAQSGQDNVVNNAVLLS